MFQILVFGARLRTTDRSDWLHREHLPNADPGIHKVAVAIRAQYNSTENPDIVWIIPVPTTSNEFEIKGQIVGTLDTLIMYVSNVKQGFIMALK